MDLSPIAHEYELRCGPERAFDVYVHRIGEWWHPDFTLDPTTLQSVTIEPRVGGRVFAAHRDVGEVDWGRVTAYEPGRRLVYTSTLAQPPETASEITVLFAPHGEGCTMRFEHGGWNEGNAALRSKFSQWRIILDRFASTSSSANGRSFRVSW
jgi:uncharacterized protein YndB with AHSA1/START domain